MRKNQIKNTVNDLIETYGTRNPYLLASYLDVTIQYGDCLLYTSPSPRD